MTPGAGSGPACAVDTQPAFPYVAPPPLVPLSTTVTSTPRRTSPSATPRPAIPPPTTTTVRVIRVAPYRRGRTRDL